MEEKKGERIVVRFVGSCWMSGGLKAVVVSVEDREQGILVVVDFVGLVSWTSGF